MSVTEKLRTYLRKNEWRPTISSMLVLLRYNPRGLSLLSRQRTEPYRLARRFRNRKLELRTRERRLKRQERDLEKERYEVRQLRLQVQSLNRRLRESQNSKASWSLVKRLKKRLNRGPEGEAALSARCRSIKPRPEALGTEQATGAEPVESLRSGAALVGMNQKTRFFLVGEMKSGTSWLMEMLSSHPEIFCGAEGTFFGRHRVTDEIPVYEAPAPSLYNAFLNSEGLRTWQLLWWNRWAKRGKPEEDLRNMTRLAIDYYMMKGSAASGKWIVGDKSPQHTDHVDEIFHFYPEAKVIHIFRDGRDVAVSLMHHFWNLSRDKRAMSKGGLFDLEPEEIAKRDAYVEDPETFLASGGSIFIEERLRQMAVRWSRMVSKGSRDGSKLFGSNFFQLSYEDLLERPEKNLRAVFEFLGAQAEDGIVHQCVEECSFEKVAGRPKGQEDGRSFFRKGVTGDWRRVFTERDRQVYEKVARDTLVKMGYPLDDRLEREGATVRKARFF